MSIDDMDNIKKGLIFGTTLQLAIGSVCLYILAIASIHGFLNAIIGVIGVTIVDTFYIGLAIIGFSRLFTTKWAKKYLGYLGIFILILFGIKMILNSICNYNSIQNGTMIIGNSVKTFFTAILLTASNPLTIIFGTGVFSTKLDSHRDGKYSTVFFSIGCILSTFLFLSLVAVIGSILSITLPIKFILILNVIVGLGLILFAGFRFIKTIKKNWANPVIVNNTHQSRKPYQPG